MSDICVENIFFKYIAYMFLVCMCMYMAYLHVCMYAHIFTGLCVGSCVCTCMYTPRLMMGSLLYCSPFYILRQSLSLEIRAHLTDWSSQPVCLRDLLPLSPQHWDYTQLTHLPSTYVGSGDTYSDPHACESNTLPHLAITPGHCDQSSHFIVSFKKSKYCQG